MIVDFQHHFHARRELIKDDPGDRLVLHYDENGAPSYTVHSLLYDPRRARPYDGCGRDRRPPGSRARPAWRPILNVRRFATRKPSRPNATIRAASSAPPMRIRSGGPEALKEPRPLQA